MKPAFEYLGFVDDINSIDDAIDIIQRSGHPDATIVVDPFHCWRGGGSAASIRKLQAHQIAISHFNDAPAVPPANTQHDSDRVLPGDGAIDLRFYCDQLPAIGYDRYLSLELFRKDLWDKRSSGSRQAWIAENERRGGRLSGRHSPRYLRVSLP